MFAPDESDNDDFDNDDGLDGYDTYMGAATDSAIGGNTPPEEKPLFRHPKKVVMCYVF
jgi:hypothetical protein